MQLAPTWDEKGALPGAVVISLDAVNQDQQDQLELENFARGLSAPAKEDLGGKAFAQGTRLGRRAMTPMDAVRFACGFAFFGGAIATVSNVRMNQTLSIVLVIAAGILGLALPGIIRIFLTKRAAPTARITHGTFVLTFDGGTFTCSGAGAAEVRLELARVRTFTGGRRLSIELVDGPATTLPLSVRGRNNTPLAMRLNDLLAASRATTSRAW